MSTIKILYDNGIEKEYKGDWKKSDLDELYNSQGQPMTLEEYNKQSN